LNKIQIFWGIYFPSFIANNELEKKLTLYLLKTAGTFKIFKWNVVGFYINHNKLAATIIKQRPLARNYTTVKFIDRSY